eukprot:1139421-Pelagomonas_calceolata.AAC.7
MEQDQDVSHCLLILPSYIHPIIISFFQSETDKNQMDSTLAKALPQRPWLNLSILCACPADEVCVERSAINFGGT